MHRIVLPTMFLMGTSVCAATIEEIEKAIIERLDSFETLAYEKTGWIMFRDSQSMHTIYEHSRVEMKRKEPVWLTRTELSRRVASTTNGIRGESLMEISETSDGEWLHWTERVDHVTKAYRSKETRCKRWLTEMRNEFDLKILPDETNEGQEYYVVEGTKGSDEFKLTSKWKIAKSSGLVVRFESSTSDGSSRIEEYTYLVSTNRPLPDDRFKLALPKGVKLELVRNGKVEPTSLSAFPAYPSLPAASRTATSSAFPRGE